MVWNTEDEGEAMLEYCKLQIGCLIVLLYIAFAFVRDCRQYHERLSETYYDTLLGIGIVSVIFDGVTAYTVNHLVSFPLWVNHLFHALFYMSLDLVMYSLFVYMLRSTELFPKAKLARWLLRFLIFGNMIYILATLPYVRYEAGTITNYSMGLPAYGCFAMAAVYIVLTIAALLYRWRYMEIHKRFGIMTYVLVLALFTGAQMVFPEILMSSIAVTMMLLGVYVNMEAPAFRALERFHGETVISFATLIESKDSSTGGHIKRTSRYVELICKELRREKQYREILTRDYVDCLKKAAPMHDIGKVAVPDAVLQKPGKLTEEEFAIMKRHAAEGGKIILTIFKNLGDEDYRRMAYEVARHHHEKWNGRGYPDGLQKEEIPLSARIMAVADVFDAVSQDRCYRAAMPMEECFAIIEQGKGRDFDPIVADAFLNARKYVEEMKWT